MDFYDEALVKCKVPMPNEVVVFDWIVFATLKFSGEHFRSVGDVGERRQLAVSQIVAKPFLLLSRNSI